MEELDGNGRDSAVKFLHWALHNHLMLVAYYHTELLVEEQVNQCFCVLAFLTYWFLSRIETNEKDTGSDNRLPFARTFCAFKSNNICKIEM